MFFPGPSDAWRFAPGTEEVLTMNNTTLIAYSLTRDGRRIITSPMVPELVTEGQGLRDSIEHLEDALDLLLKLSDESGRNLTWSWDEDTIHLPSQGSAINQLETQTLVDVRRIGDDRFLMTSAEIPALVTEGKGEKDSLRHLKDALSLLLEVDRENHEVFTS
jgi:predicted RNase H-like HicB family nuclease